jgi:DNA-binding PadR family transcriptional regulator
MLSILEYLCTNAENMPVTKYHIISRLPSIKRQRPDRISKIMDTLERKGLIKSIKTPNATYYSRTEKGYAEYSGWVRSFLDFSRSVVED